ncbi:hypothetical protein [Kaistella antarctica]|uniref:Uncharacterized protein n=1 Tax=Kaistella antarctica TaxID=266748 RepID=A0A448NR17_9FLAO|nr:hypothetical protein [Kaistella antarctica]KEY18957.1 hypothetical protein HY04_10900 [Kaistella antarctica]VEH99184.1 Uncharacterised protein [Kaistella antarctica]
MADCLFKNGQSFSNLKHSCLELSTVNIQLNPLENGASTKGNICYILFDNKNNNGEIFLPLQDKGIILKKTVEGNWSNGEYNLIA